jgi:hypothetical protein
MGDNMQLHEIITDLRTSIAFSKRAGNEGHMLANGKGMYRPVAEVLQPALDALLAAEALIEGVKTGLEFNTPSMTQRLGMIRNEIDAFEINLEPKLNAANAAKAAAARR